MGMRQFVVQGNRLEKPDIRQLHLLAKYFFAIHAKQQWKIPFCVMEANV